MKTRQKCTIEKQFASEQYNIFLKWTGKNPMNKNIQELSNRLELVWMPNIPKAEILKHISWIRTIMKDLEETYLELNGTYFEEIYHIIYTNGQLYRYYVEKPSNIQDHRIGIKYEIQKKLWSSSKIEAEYWNTKSDKKEPLDLNTLKDLETQLMQELNKVYISQSMEPMIPDRDHTMIPEMYHQFYQKQINLNSKTLHEEIQIMMIILEMYDLSLNYKDYHYHLTNTSIPMSLLLYTKVHELVLINNPKMTNIPVRLTPEAAQKIAIIGQMIQEYLQSVSNKEEEMISLCQLILKKNQQNQNPYQSTITPIDQSETQKRLQFFKTTHRKLQEQEEL